MKDGKRKPRGIVTMHRLTKRKIMGVKKEVLYNKRWQPLGKAAREMQSYIGVLARTKIKITHKNWKAVPKEEKNKVWEVVEVCACFMLFSSYNILSFIV